MKIAIGCDHIVTPIKDEVIKELKSRNIEVLDCGTNNNVRTHFPIFGRKIAVAVASKKCDFGIAICGTGVGITNAAQKTKGARVILCRDVLTAIDARKKYDANILGFGGRISGIGFMLEAIEAFINTKYQATKERDKIIKDLEALNKDDKLEENLFNKELKKWDEGFYHD